MPIAQPVPNTHETSFQQFIQQHAEISKLLKNGYIRQAIHVYRDKQQHEIYRKLRLKNYAETNKWIRPFIHDGQKWKMGEPDFPEGKKTLYCLPNIYANPGATIVVVEGEFKADVLNKKFTLCGLAGKYVATTSGGSNTAGKADWNPLKNRNTINWRDNDKAGIKYAHEVTQILVGLDCAVQWVNIEKLNLPEGGDAVDYFEAHPTDTEKHWATIMAELIPAPSMVSPIEPLFPPEDGSVDKFLKEAPPPREYLLNECLPVRKVGVLVGMGGVRKSQLLLQALISIATGIPLCGRWGVGTQGSVLGLFAEEDEEELHRRLYYTTEGFSAEHKKLVSERVKIRSVCGSNTQMTNKTGSEVQITEFVDRLIHTIKQYPDTKLVVIDPASRFRGGDENSSLDTTRFVEACELVVRETGVTVLIAHHVNKGSIKEEEASQAAARGSSALTDGVRWQMNLSVMSVKEAKALGVKEERRRYHVKANLTKGNYAPPQEGDIWLEMAGKHGVLKYVQFKSLDGSTVESTIHDIVLKVKSEAAKGVEYSKSGFAKAYGGAKTGIFGIGEQGLRGLIEQALENEMLVEQTPKIPKQNVAKVLALGKHVIDSAKAQDYDAGDL